VVRWSAKRCGRVACRDQNQDRDRERPCCSSSSSGSLLQEGRKGRIGASEGEARRATGCATRRATGHSIGNRGGSAYSSSRYNRGPDAIDGSATTITASRRWEREHVVTACQARVPQSK